MHKEVRGKEVKVRGMFFKGEHVRGKIILNLLKSGQFYRLSV